MDEKERIGFIGVGLMGHGVAQNILQAGYPTTVLAHRNRAPVDDLVAKGANEVGSAAVLAESSEVVFLCVTGSPQVEDVMFRDDGLLRGLKPRTIVLDLSTAVPASTLNVAEAVEARGGHYLDIPMTRTPKEAEEGKLALMVGGSKEILEKVQPILNSFSDTVVHCGDVGSGHTVKLVNNFLALGNAALICEAIVTAAKAGVGMEALRDVVCSGGADSIMFRRFMTILLEGNENIFRFVLQNAQKDIRYYTDMARNLPSTAFIAESIHQTYVMASNLGHGNEYVPRLMRILAEINDVELGAITSSAVQ